MHVIPDSSQDPSIEQRRIPRHQLSAYLCVYNSRTGRPIGYIGNISRDGIMLICALPVMLDQQYELELKLPDLDDPLSAQRLGFHGIFRLRFQCGYPSRGLRRFGAGSAALFPL